jgi:uncharacterized membrane protein YphA (DoxX/SURF4 family)
MKRLFSFIAILIGLAAPGIASAHEVYVLTPAEIALGLATPPFSPIDVMLQNLGSFFFWGFVCALTVGVIFGISVVRPWEKFFNPLFTRLKKYAPAITRITIGISFITAAYHQALFGPELPLAADFGSFGPWISSILALLGFLITIGLLTRIAAFLALILFAAMTYFHGTYMLTYTNYLGEIIVLLLLGGYHGSIEGTHTRFREARHALDALAKKFAPYSFVALRVAFGISLLYASVYAKFFHDFLALQVAELPLAGHEFGIAHYFGLEPHFMVLGAGIIEIVIATFFILGVEIRFTSLFLEFWLAVSLWWFGETVWPHIVLIGIPIAFLIYGYDKYSLEGYFFKKGQEPFL